MLDQFVSLAPTNNEPETMRHGAEFLIKRAEDNRREEHTVPAQPIRGITDYAPASQWIETAMHHLDEGLPNGQKERCEAALGLLALGFLELWEWCEARGYEPAAGILAWHEFWLNQEKRGVR